MRSETAAGDEYNLVYVAESNTRLLGRVGRICCVTGQAFLPVLVVPAGISLTPGIEGTLDVEASLSMAPAAQVVAFVGNSNRTAILTNMTDSPAIKQFTSSWFWYNGTTTDTNLMLQLGTQGQSFFQASGDGAAYQVGVFPTYVSGSLDCRQFPSITLVGGTSLNMSGSGTSYGTLETAWSLSFRRNRGVRRDPEAAALPSGKATLRQHLF
jgi:subtilase family serine protease